MKKIKFAVCGFGRIGKRHAKIISEHRCSALSGVIDIRDNSWQDLGTEKYASSFYENIDNFIRDDKQKTDVVVVATPNGSHASLTKKLLLAGYHVVIEKPMALVRPDCEDIINLAYRMGKNIFVVKQNRYSPTSRWMKDVVENGAVGDVLMVQINCYWNRDERYYTGDDWHGSMELDGGTLYTQFSHFIDIMYWVFGDIKNISARTRNFTHKNIIEFEDSGIVHFDFVRGGIGSINYSTSCWDKNMESSITVVGSKGSLKVGGQYMEKVEYCHIKNYKIPELEPTNAPNDYGPYKGSAANHHYVIENVVDTLSGKGFIGTNALEGMKVVEMIEKIYEQRSKPMIKQNGMYERA